MQEQQVEQWTKGGQKQNLGNKGDWDITPQREISELFSAQLGELPHFKEKNHAVLDWDSGVKEEKLSIV